MSINQKDGVNIVQIFKGKAVCPSCDGNGLIFKTRLKCNNLVLYVCDQCDATWKHSEDIGAKQFLCLQIMLDEYGVGWGNLELTDYEWLNNEGRQG